MMYRHNYKFYYGGWGHWNVDAHWLCKCGHYKKATLEEVEAHRLAIQVNRELEGTK